MRDFDPMMPAGGPRPCTGANCEHCNRGVKVSSEVAIKLVMNSLIISAFSWPLAAMFMPVWPVNYKSIIKNES